MDTLSYAMNIFGGYYLTPDERGWRHYRVRG